jgi:hypothetical protein
MSSRGLVALEGTRKIAVEVKAMSLKKVTPSLKLEVYK